MGEEEKSKAYIAFARTFYLHPHVYTSLYLSTFVRDTNIHIPAGDDCLSGVLYWRFLHGSTGPYFGGWPSASGQSCFDARRSKASDTVWYESDGRTRLVHSMAQGLGACREFGRLGDMDVR